MGYVNSGYRYNIGEYILSNSQNIRIINRKTLNGEYYYKYICNKCGFDMSKYCYVNGNEISDFWIREVQIYKEYKCPCCSNRVVQPGINDIGTTSPWMNNYFQGGIEEAKKYSKNSHVKIYPKCIYCGRINKTGILISELNHKKKYRCICSDGISYPNKFMFSVLEQLNVDFKNEEYVIDEDNNTFYYYDFFIKDKNLYIEMDGGIGHGKRVFSNSKYTPEETLKRDKRKDLIAIKNGGTIIRIEADESNKEYLEYRIKNSILSNYYDLKIIDWNKCEEFALKNIVKLVCNKYNCNNFTTNELSRYFKLSLTTIIKYLKIGNKLGWCKYYNNKIIFK